MISERGHVNLEPAQVAAVFADIDNWHRWMPGLERVRILERREHGAKLAMEQRFHGREFNQELLCGFGPTEVHQQQIRGQLRHWECRWTFAPPPDGRGTTISTELHIELGGVMGLLISDRILGEFLERSFRETLRKLEQWGRRQAAATDTHAQPGDDVILQLFETEQGLELWLDGKTYRLTPGTQTGSGN